MAWLRSLAGFVFMSLVAMGLGAVPAAARTERCLVISGTGDGLVKRIAVERAQDAVEDAIAKWQAENGVQTFDQTAWKPEPRPYWRNSVFPDLYYTPDEVTDQVYTICWKGVVSPAVCTSGARVCWQQPSG